MTRIRQHADCGNSPKNRLVQDLTIEHVLSHGRAGAVDGVVEFGNKRRAFCQVYELSNAAGSRVKALTSYSISLKWR